jgi:hypothetical protein
MPVTAPSPARSHRYVAETPVRTRLEPPGLARARGAVYALIAFLLVAFWAGVGLTVWVLLV